MIRPEEIGYADELLADGTVHRTYENGLEEWRRRTPGQPHVVHWHDNRGASGTDELLGDRVIKRSLADGTVSYARDIGYGRTLSARGAQVLVNRSSFGGRMGVLLAGLGVATLAVTAAQLPPLSLSPEQEEALRQQQAQASQSSGGGGDSGGGDGGGSVDGGSDDANDWDAAWDGEGDAWNDDDFG
ncbi:MULTISPECIES: hypothetical protein [Streptomyces]|uniref:Uncharacterized protein n=1 Tax=Streptomyces venezuelae (strain ATCC 10712 / CBS 650.69 / DSM 40230 / JCM 4526 / NBRC 13096 / PD 04745) TaxID=953739 RepID=F2R4K7_STRVP|nr:hypothetical protein [Streptomyces venezuelae]APE19698.1 hypothetical protein vnz_00925 [Streptomyces venezuelae]QER97111.1 hypothetical protein DEJ43_00940 [Streptomyces venezuelae ATCC 10712]CCA53484.1 hypothetical protein SVEN_0196 [Streptomyces venezuelae ATCC 10712]